MIAQLSQLSETAEPTPFHRFLRVLDERRRLLRVYTQNIDALEEKSGLSFGVPELDDKRCRPRASKTKTIPPSAGPSEEPVVGRLPSPPAETPRCIPLHGTLQSMYCQTCRHPYPLRDYIGPLSSGTPPPCPQCTTLEATRQLVGKRSRGVGRLRPSVVLYNEDHKDGEEVGNVVRKDLIGSSKGKGRAGADLLLVVGTSLRVPGTKRIVREFSKAVRSRYTALNAPSEDPATSSHGLATPTPSPRRSPTEDEEPPMRTVYLNLDFPVPTREWEGVFDVWIRGDAQSFAQMVHDELERERQAKEALQERRKRREEAAAESARQAEEREKGEVVASSEESSPVKKGKKRKEQSHSESDGHARPAKKRKTGAPPPSPVSPAKKARKTKVKEGKQKRPRDSSLPTPPVSRDDPKRLTIKLPPRSQIMAGVVIETVAPKLPGSTIPLELPCSPLSSPPASSGERSPPLSPRTSRHAPSPMCTPPRGSRITSPYDLSRISSTLSQISSPLSSPPSSIALPSPPKMSRTMSGATQLSSPLSSAPSSPYREDPPSHRPSRSPYRDDMSLPPTPPPTFAHKRRAASGTGSMIGGWLGQRPGVRQTPSYGRRFAAPAHDDDDVDVDVVGFSEDESDAPRYESRLPESYMRTAVHPAPRRRGRVR